MSAPLPVTTDRGSDPRLLEVLQDRVRTQGPLSFDEFMDLALYHPGLGYYARAEDPVGADAGRDYYTSPTRHPAFGALLGKQVAECLERVGGSRRQWVEFGPGSGDLACAVLAQLRSSGLGPAQGVEAVLVEANPHRQAAQNRRLQERGSIEGVRWMTPAAWEAEEDPVRGCFFANELLDAMPVRRFRLEGGQVREVMVGWQEGPVEVMKCADEGCGAFPENPSAPREGQEWEVGSAARHWIERAARRLERGYVLLLDYGHLAPEIHSPRHQRGTLMAYHRHRASEEYLERLGRQDLTAHVNFSALLEAASACGLEARGPIGQGRFLMALGAMQFLAGGESWDGLKDFQSRKMLQELLLPGGMGESHQVLVLATPGCGLDLEGLCPPALWTEPSPASRREMMSHGA